MRQFQALLLNNKTDKPKVYMIWLEMLSLSNARLGGINNEMLVVEPKNELLISICAHIISSSFVMRI
jgi:hypothetical protein